MRNDAGDVSQTRLILRAMIENHGSELVRRYFDRGPTDGSLFAGALFDTLGDNDPTRITAEDLVAVSLLDVRFGPDAVYRLLLRGEANSLLAAVDPALELWAAGAELDEQSAAWKLWRLLTGIPGIGPTKASKLMSRKRPRLIPIVDSVIRAKLSLGNIDTWAAMRAVLEDPETRDAIDGLRQTVEPVAGYSPSMLRLVDVLTWMHASESDAARTVRKRLGLPISTQAGATDDDAR